MSNLTPIVLSLVQTIQTALNQGDDKTLKRLNISRKNAESLVNLSAAEIAFLASTQVFNVSVDHQRLPTVIHNAQLKSAELRLIDELILGGATHTFIGRFFALTAHDMAARRKVLEIDCPGGRAKEPDKKTVDRIYQYWKKNKPTGANAHALARAVLITAQALKVKFSDVVYTVERDLPPAMNTPRRLN